MMALALFAAATTLSVVGGMFSGAALSAAEKDQPRKAATNMTLWAAMQLSALTVAYAAGVQP